MKNKFKKFGLMLFILLFFSVVSLVSVSAVDVDNFTEMNTAIQSGDNVTLNHDIIVTDEDVDNVGKEGIIINHDVTVDGQGYAIDGKHKVRFFNITNNNAVLTLKNIELINGNSTRGGAISGDNDLNLICIGTVIFSNNKAEHYGGVISPVNISSNVNITADNILFNDNIAGWSGGAIYSTNGDVNIISNKIEFTDNIAGWSDDGAIVAASIFLNCSNLICTNDTIFAYRNISIITSDSIICDKGRIKSYKCDVNIIANNKIIFNDNNFEGDGGAIYAHDNINIKCNGDVIFNNNTVTGSGGAIHCLEGDVNINATNLIFTNNKAKDNNSNGGAINSGGNINLYVNYVEFKNNVAKNRGGAISVNNDLNIISKINATFINNSATYGSAICSNLGDYLIISSSNINFYNNIGRAINTFSAGTTLIINSLGNVTFEYNEGGCIDVGNVMIFADNIFFNHNNANDYGTTAIYTDGGYVFINCTNNVSFSNNIANSGGAIYAGEVTIIGNNVIFFNNKATANDSYGGAISSIDNVDISSTNILFKNNSATTSGAVAYSSRGKIVFTTDELTGIDNIANNTYDGASFNTFDNITTINNETIKNSEFGRYYHYTSSKIKLKANDLTMYYKDGSKFTVELKNGTTPLFGKTIKIVLNSQTYERITDSEGIASMNINLDTGSYSVTATYEGLTSDATINVKSTISGDNITKIYKNDTQYYAKFLDKKGNPLTNTDVQFNINGVLYSYY